MRFLKHNGVIWLELGRLSFSAGFIKGIYLGFQLDKDHFSLDLGVGFIDIYW